MQMKEQHQSGYIFVDGEARCRYLVALNWLGKNNHETIFLSWHTSDFQQICMKST